MDPFAHQIAERCIDQSLPIDSVLSDKNRTFDAQLEVAFAFRIVAAVTAMLLALVDELYPGWRKRRIEPAKHFSCDRTGSLCVHLPYIEGFDDNEAIQDARAG